MPELVIPWRDAGCEFRRRHFEALVEFYSKTFTITIGDNEGQFNRSAARNAGVAAAKSDIVTVIDADNLIHPKAILNAITLAKHTDVMVKPFEWFGYLDDVSTVWVYEHGFDIVDGIEKTFQSPPQKNFNGGAYTISKANWDLIGGFDTNFTGWGAEDDAFHIMCERTFGKARHVNGMAYHLFHPSYRVTSRTNYNYLMRKYVNGN